MLTRLQDNLRRRPDGHRRNRVQQAFCCAPLEKSRPDRASLLLQLHRGCRCLDALFSIRHRIPMPAAAAVDIFAVKLSLKGQLTVRSHDIQHGHRCHSFSLGHSPSVESQHVQTRPNRCYYFVRNPNHVRANVPSSLRVVLIKKQNTWRGCRPVDMSCIGHGFSGSDL